MSTWVSISNVYMLVPHTSIHQLLSPTGGHATFKGGQLLYLIQTNPHSPSALKMKDARDHIFNFQQTSVPYSSTKDWIQDSVIT